MSERRRFALPDARANFGPDRSVEVRHITLDLRPDIELRRLDGCATTTVQAIEDGVGLLVLDAVDLRIAAVRRLEDGEPLPAPQPQDLDAGHWRPRSPASCCPFARRARSSK